MREKREREKKPDEKKKRKKKGQFRAREKDTSQAEKEASLAEQKDMPGGKVQAKQAGNKQAEKLQAEHAGKYKRSM